MIHNQHVWLCDVAKKEFDQHYGGAEVVPRDRTISPDLSKIVSNKWRHAVEPSGELIEIVTDTESVLA